MNNNKFDSDLLLMETHFYENNILYFSILYRFYYLLNRFVDLFHTVRFKR